MLKKHLTRNLALLGLTLVSHSLSAATTLVAVAANFSKPMTEIAAEFAKTTGHSAKLSFGSSGKFVSQIENAAPFEIFLSADESGPEKLEQSGLAVAGTRFNYALGKLVLWSATDNYVDGQGKVLSNGSFKHIAIADPRLSKTLSCPTNLNRCWCRVKTSRKPNNLSALAMPN
jgi:molybdate transport system substrate-binding protein